MNSILLHYQIEFSIDDLYSFVSRISNNVDSYGEEREECNNLINCWQDAGSTKRVADFIIERISKLC